CVDRANNPDAARWRPGTAPGWVYNPDTGITYYPSTATQAAINRAADNVTRNRNDCGTKGRPNIGQHFAGYTHDYRRTTCLPTKVDPDGVARLPDSG
ncbi:MAG: hypothetical protein ABR585_14620, partial [Gemmatimonadaceae bacterium]